MKRISTGICQGSRIQIVGHKRNKATAELQIVPLTGCVDGLCEDYKS
jgi:hypothetical protein